MTEWRTWIHERFKMDDERFNNSSRDIEMLLHLQLIDTLHQSTGKKKRKKKGHWKSDCVNHIESLYSILILTKVSRR